MATTLKLTTDIKKLKGALSSKSLPAPIKAKLKAQLDKAQNELKAIKSGGKPRKVSTTKGTQTALTSLQKLINKKKYGIYKGKVIDLKKDAEEGALPIGRRISKGIKGNQFGDAKSSKGNVYYEYRANRLDVKQPKGKQKYPKLEHGGMMAKGGETDDFFFDKRSDVKFKFSPNEHIKVLQYDNGRLKKLGATIFEQYAAEQNDGTYYPFYKVIGDWEKADENGKKYSLLYSEGELINRHGNKPKKMEQGGYMAKGGMMADGGVLNNKQKLILELQKTIKKALDLILQIYPDNQNEFDKLPIMTRENLFATRKAIYDAHSHFFMNGFEKGGYMAKGGDLSSIKEQYLQNEDENAHSENVVLLAKHFGTKEDLAKAKEILAIHEKEGNLSSENGKKRRELHLKLIDKARKEMAKESIEFEKGGMMAHGGMMAQGEELMGASQNGEPKPSGFFLVKKLKTTAIVKDEDGNLEKYGKSPSFAGYHLIIDGEDYEFLSSYNEKGGYMEDGGLTDKEVVESNAEMVLSKIKEVHHHADELEDIVTKKSDIEAWVVAKIERASTDLSDITHYLDGQHEKMSMGGSINNYVHKMDKK